MAVVISLGIAMAVVAFVAAPFFLLTGHSSRPAASSPEPSEALQELAAEKENLYAAIQELDFDQKSGKLSGEDHTILRRRYEAQAAVILKRIDEMEQAARSKESPGASRREKQTG